MTFITPLFADRAVAATFESQAGPVRDRLLELRTLIFETAAGLEDVGELTESLKWGQPSYVPRRARLGTPIRLAPHDADTVAVYVSCNTRLVDEWRARFGTALSYAGDRALLFAKARPVPRDLVGAALEMALRYHRLKAGWRRS